MDYGERAAAYAEHRRHDPAVLATLVAGAGVTASSRVLEVGSGTGNYAIELHGLTGARCTGVEPSEAMRQVAVERSAAVRFVAGSAEQLPFADAVFDLVFSVDVAHQLADLGVAFRETARVLVPGGSACVATDDETSIRGRLHSHYFPESVDVELARYHPLAEVEAALGAAGLLVGEVERTATPVTVTDARPYRELAFSSLALLGEEAHRAGLERLERDLARGPVEAVDHHVLVWAMKP